MNESDLDSILKRNKGIRIVSEQKPKQGSDPRKQGSRLVKPYDAESGMNKTETAFSLILEAYKRAGEIKDWKFEPIKFKLCSNIEGKRNAVQYIPDFMVEHHDHIEFIETKAKTKNWSSMQDDARAKVNIASDMFPCFKFTVAYKTKEGWEYEPLS